MVFDAVGWPEVGDRFAASNRRGPFNVPGGDSGRDPPIVSGTVMAAGRELDLNTVLEINPHRIGGAFLLNGHCPQNQLRVLIPSLIPPPNLGMNQSGTPRDGTRRGNRVG